MAILAVVAVVVPMLWANGVQAVASVSASAVSPLETPENNAADTSGTVLPPLQLQWHRAFHRPVDGALAAGGKVFASAGSMVYALDPMTGRRVWGPVDTGSWLNDGALVSLAYDAGRLFVSTQFGEVIAYDAATGQRLWWRRGATVLAGHGALLTSTDELTIRLDERTGDPIWRFRTRQVARSSITAGEVVLAEYSDDWGLRLTDGALLWHTGGYTMTASPRDRPVIAGDRVVVDNESDQQQGLTVMNRSTGATIATLRGDTSPTIVGDIGVVRLGSSFVGVDLNSGSTVWTFAGDGHLVSRAVAENGDVYVASSTGHLWAVSAADGTVQWSGTIPQGYGNRSGTEYQFAVPMTIGQGLLLLPIDHQLLAYRPDSGAQVPATAALPQPPLRATPIVEGDAGNQEADAQHTSRMASSGLGLPLRRTWTREFAGNVSYAVIGTRRVFVVTYTSADNRSYLHGLSRRTGRDVWPAIDIGSGDLGDGGAGGPCMDDKRVYVTSPARSIAVDRATGRIIWSKYIAATRDGGIGQGSSICTTSNGWLYVEGPSLILPAGGTAGMVFGVRAATGRVRWATSVSAEGGVSPVAVQGNTVLLNLTHYQAAFDAKNGARIWWHHRGDGYSDQPAVAYQHRLWVLDDITGTRNIGSGQLHPGFSGGVPAFYGSRMFIDCGGDLLSEDTSTRLVVWRRHLASPVTYPPFVVNQLVLAVTADGVLHAFSLRGRELWHGAIGAPANLDGAPWWPGPLDPGPEATIAAAHGTVIVPAGRRLTAWQGR